MRARARASGGWVRWYSIPEAASAVEWHTARMHEAVQRGEVPAFKVNGELVVPAALLVHFGRRGLCDE